MIKRYPALAVFCGFSESEGWNAARQVNGLRHGIPKRKKWRNVEIEGCHLVQYALV